MQGHSVSRGKQLVVDPVLYIILVSSQGNLATVFKQNLGLDITLLESVKTSSIQQHVACNMVCLQLHQFGLLAMHLVDEIPLCLYQYTATGYFLYNSWQRQYDFSGHFRGIPTNRFLRLWSLKHDNDDSGSTKPVKLTIASEQHYSCHAMVVVHMFQNLRQLGARSMELFSRDELRLTRGSVQHSNFLEICRSFLQWCGVQGACNFKLSDHMSVGHSFTHSSMASL